MGNTLKSIDIYKRNGIKNDIMPEYLRIYTDGHHSNILKDLEYRYKNIIFVVKNLGFMGKEIEINTYYPTNIELSSSSIIHLKPHRSALYKFILTYDIDGTEQTMSLEQLYLLRDIYGNWDAKDEEYSINIFENTPIIVDPTLYANGYIDFMFRI